MKAIKQVVVCMLIMMLAISVVGCGDKAGSQVSENGSSTTEVAKNTPELTDDSWTKVKDKGEIVIAGCPEYPPFSSRSKDGKVEGFDIDFANALGKELGVKVNFKDTAWEGLVAGLNKGDHDAIISCMSPEEAKQGGSAVNFSDKYYDLSEIIVVKKSNALIKKKEDLDGKIIGCQTGTTSEVAVNSLKDKGIKVAEVKKYNRDQEALIDLKNGRIDAVVVGFAYAVTQANNDPGLTIINDSVRSVPIVVVLRKDNNELTTKINEAVKDIKNNGTYDKITKKWLDI